MVVIHDITLTKEIFKKNTDAAGVAGIFSQMPKYTPGIFWLSKYVPLLYCILCDKVILLHKYNIYAFKSYF